MVWMNLISNPRIVQHLISKRDLDSTVRRIIPLSGCLSVLAGQVLLVNRRRYYWVTEMLGLSIYALQEIPHEHGSRVPHLYSSQE